MVLMLLIDGNKREREKSDQVTDRFLYLIKKNPSCRDLRDFHTFIQTY